MVDELDDEARRMLKLAVRAERRLPRDRARVLQGVLLAVSAPSTASAAASASAGKSAFMAGKQAFLAMVLRSTALKVVSLAALGSTVAHVALREPIPTRDHARPVVTQHPVHEHRALPAKAVKSAPLDLPAPAQPLPSPAQVEVKRAPRPVARVHMPAEPVNETAPASAPAESDAPAPAARPSSPPLAPELALLLRAQHALRAGDAALALSQLEGAVGPGLLPERTALRVFALCALKRVAEARAAADAFRTLAPVSPLVPRIEASCAGRESTATSHSE